MKFTTTDAGTTVQLECKNLVCIGAPGSYGTGVPLDQFQPLKEKCKLCKRALVPKNLKVSVELKCSSGVYFLDGKHLLPKKSLELRNHSPDGFAHGYGGSGPSQLALAILLEVYDKETAISHYMEFKWEVISKLPQGGFITEIVLCY